MIVSLLVAIVVVLLLIILIFLLSLLFGESFLIYKIFDWSTSDTEEVVEANTGNNGGRTISYEDAMAGIEGWLEKGASSGSKTVSVHTTTERGSVGVEQQEFSIEQNTDSEGRRGLLVTDIARYTGLKGKKMVVKLEFFYADGRRVVAREGVGYYGNGVSSDGYLEYTIPMEPESDDIRLKVCNFVPYVLFPLEDKSTDYAIRLSIMQKKPNGEYNLLSHAIRSLSLNW